MKPFYMETLFNEDFMISKKYIYFLPLRNRFFSYPG